MCFLLSLAVWRDQSKTKDGKYALTGIETAILARLALYAHSDGTNVHPSLNTLVAEVKFSKRTIQNTIDSLLKKQRIIRVEKGCSKTHKSNKYNINLSLLPDSVSIKTPEYKDVDKLVDNTPSKTSPVEEDSIGAIEKNAIGAIAGNAIHKSLIKVINKSHMIGTQQDDVLKANLFNELISIGYYEKAIPRDIKRFGVEPIFHKLSMLKQLAREGKINIKNLGAYLRTTLNQEDKK